MTRHESADGYTAMGAISLVTKRELRGNLMKKGTIITMLLTLLLVVGGVLVAAYLTRDDGPAEEKVVAVVGEAPFAQSVEEITKQAAQAEQAAKSKESTKDESEMDAAAGPAAQFGAAFGMTMSPIKLTPVADEAAARDLLEKEEAIAALVPGATPQSWTLINADAPVWLPGMLQESLANQLQFEEITKQGGDPVAVLNATTSGQIDVKVFDESKEIDYTAILVVGIGIGLIYMGIMMFGGAVAQSVVEEKSSRVVEIMLATIRPLHLLTGKLLGAGIAGMIMLIVILFGGVVAILATGIAKDFEIPWGAVGLLIPFYIFGYFFFAALYAMAGSLVSRMEDFQGAQTPVLLLSLLTIYIPAFGWQFLDSTVMRVLAWIPPVSITTAPLQYAVGNMSALEVLGAAGILIIACIIVLFMAARIYPQNVLHTGARVTWTKALVRQKS
ncbi:ABC transporter permease [Corynebacterium sp. H113]|uniref:ABC transporter permease n=1 Tax=Corynebacterium sp. H113 TaxID=3133419 RepID=UPI0030A125E4